MSILVGGWLSWAERRLGPSTKTGYGDRRYVNTREGVVYHSAEGSWGGLLSVLYGPRRASWTASNLKDGRFIQHYPINAVAWTNGSREANERFIGIENEGVAGEPLTDDQVENLIRFAKECVAYYAWPGFERQKQAWEHLEMTRYGAEPTACPSGRIPWARILAAVTPPPEEDDMITHKLYATWNPARLWLVQYVAEVPVWKRWITTQDGATVLKIAFGDPKNTTLAALESVPSL